MEYNFKAIEKKWQEKWVKQDTYRVLEDPSRPKYYVLNMFPYPSGAGLHVGHPLGYIASDIYARYKRQCGFNVLNPMGYDAYRLTGTVKCVPVSRITITGHSGLS
jgi:leucyl-tRNA synthetase